MLLFFFLFFLTSLNFRSWLICWVTKLVQHTNIESFQTQPLWIRLLVVMEDSVWLLAILRYFWKGFGYFSSPLAGDVRTFCWKSSEFRKSFAQILILADGVVKLFQPLTMKSPFRISATAATDRNESGRWSDSDEIETRPVSFSIGSLIVSV